MTQLWEDTIVTALRDAQWLRCPGRRLPKSAFPPGFVKLDGNAESAIGDVIYSAEERYFIFEVKARRADAKSEWVVAKGNAPKRAYRTLAEYWEALEKLSSLDEKSVNEKEFESNLLMFFKLSLAGHHFVYWDDWVDDCGEEIGEIVVEPYIGACIQLFEEKHDISPWQYLKPWPGTYFGFTWGAGAHRLTSEVISLDEALDSNVNICFFDDGRLPDHKVGLTLYELQRYVNMLVGLDEEDEGIFAVVMSNTGSFYRVVGSTKHLAKIMIPRSAGMSPRRQRTPRGSQRGFVPPVP